MQTLIDEAIADQQELSAVNSFSKWHDKQKAGVPALAQHYRQLIPLTTPQPGEQYAFQVDLDACSGCKGCVTACHALNGLEEEETWRSVGLLVRHDPIQSFSLPGLPRAAAHPKPPRVESNPNASHQHVTTACHHCVDPACLNGCPVLAYDKDPRTGVVRHLDDQCIGCSYCVMMCPYEVPRYSARLGIVRKCDLCQGRLAVGEAPACVQACPNQAIRVTLVRQKDIGHGFRLQPFNGKESTNRFLPATPDPRITLPTTRYLSTRLDGAEWKAADQSKPRLAPAHSSLVGMLVLTQAAAGLALSTALGLAVHPATSWLTAIALVIGLAVGGLHLGQPLKAWRGFLGWRRSWLSREFAAFATFAAFSCLHAFHPTPWSGGMAAALGILSVACSVMVYVATRRPCWSVARTTLRFAGTSLSLGALIAAPLSPHAALLAFVGGGLVASKLLGELITQFLTESREVNDPLARSRQLLLGPLRPIWLARVALALAAIFTGIGFGLLQANWLAVIGILFALAGELLERHLFFRSEASVRMPGP